MIYLIGSIILTSYLTLSFKVLERLRIPVLQAIVFNYFTCVVTGSVVAGGFPLEGIRSAAPWLGPAVLMGSLFISLFNLIGFTAQRIGVAVASVANKLSLIIPFAFSIWWYGEPLTALKSAGLLLALIAVVLTCWPSSAKATAGEPAVVAKAPTSKALSPLLRILLPVILFLGSGFLDTLVKWVEAAYLNSSNSNEYLITSFGVAAVAGTAVLLVLLLTGRQAFSWRSLPAGILIGIPNYFSIWCLVEVLKQNAGRASAIIPVNNMGIVLFSTLAAWLLFRERLTLRNWAGIGLSLIAIGCIAFG